MGMAFVRILLFVLPLVLVFTTCDSGSHNNKKKNPCLNENIYITGNPLQWNSPQYPAGETNSLSCTLRIRRDPKRWRNILQIKVIIADFHLSQPEKGMCKEDNVTIEGSVIQGQAKNRIQLCGEEPDDFISISGTQYPQYKHLYLNFGSGKDAEIVFRANLSPSKYWRRWKILLKPVESGSPELAPAGCTQYYSASHKHQPYFQVIRSFNYPNTFRFGMIDNVQAGICFSSIGLKFPVTGLRLTPDAGSFKANPFQLGGRSDRSDVDANCTTSFIVLTYSTGLLPTRMCGGRFNPKSGQQNDVPIVLKHGPFPRIEFRSSSEKGGFRFLWSFDAVAKSQP